MDRVDTSGYPDTGINNLEFRIWIKVEPVCPVSVWDWWSRSIPVWRCRTACCVQPAKPAIPNNCRYLSPRLIQTARYIFGRPLAIGCLCADPKNQVWANRSVEVNTCTLLATEIDTERLGAVGVLTRHCNRKDTQFLRSYLDHLDLWTCYLRYCVLPPSQGRGR